MRPLLSARDGAAAAPSPACLPPRRSQSIQTYWTNFARTGNPNTGGAVKLQWPALTADEHVIKLQTPANVAETAPFKQECALWDSFGYNFA